MRYMLSQNNPRSRSTTTGFTLIEMLVVAPLIILLIGTMIAYLSSLTGSGLQTNTQMALAYDTQDALGDIETYGSLATSFLSSTSTLPNGQGKNSSPSNPNDSTAFNDSSATLMMQVPATTKNPLDPARTLIYKGSSPCDPSADPLKYVLIYFVANGALYKRTIIPYPTGTTGCATPYQRNTCNPDVMALASPPSICQARDEKLLDNVVDIFITYYKEDGVTSTDPGQANNAQVDIDTSQKVADNTLEYKGSLRIRATNYKATPSP